MHGTGLGLWISADIVRKHKGTLRVRSRQHHSACGTVFCLFLPFESVLSEQYSAESIAPGSAGNDGEPLP